MDLYKCFLFCLFSKIALENKKKCNVDEEGFTTNTITKTVNDGKLLILYLFDLARLNILEVSDLGGSNFEGRSLTPCVSLLCLVS